MERLRGQGGGDEPLPQSVEELVHEMDATAASAAALVGEAEEWMQELEEALEHQGKAMVVRKTGQSTVGRKKRGHILTQEERTLIRERQSERTAVEPLPWSERMKRNAAELLKRCAMAFAWWLSPTLFKTAVEDYGIYRHFRIEVLGKGGGGPLLLHGGGGTRRWLLRPKSPEREEEGVSGAPGVRGAPGAPGVQPSCLSSGDDDSSLLYSYDAVERGEGFEAVEVGRDGSGEGAHGGVDGDGTGEEGPLLDYSRSYAAS